MLVRFVTNNYLSFREEQEFNMLAGPFRSHKHHVYKSNGLSVLKGTAIYGANGAGKSNLVKALDFFKETVKYRGLQKSINNKKFKLDESNLEKPVDFEIEFVLEKKVYAYGFSIDGNILTKEWLYLTGVNKEDKLVFERKTDKNKKSRVTLASRYAKSAKMKLLIELMEENLLKADELFLGKFENLKITDIRNVWEWITKNLFVIFPESKYGKFLVKPLQKEHFADFVNDLLRTFDTGIAELAVEDIDFDVFFSSEEETIKEEILQKLEDEPSVQMPYNEEYVLVVKQGEKVIVKKMITKHIGAKAEDVIFSIEEESDGTQRLLDFIPVFGALKGQATFVIDEIGQSLHPTLLYTLVKKIMGEENTKGQLIFTTHESNLLDFDIFRQDEIWFAEKDKQGGTQLYSLSDFKPRHDLDIRKGYLKGRFGAIPFTSDLKNLNWAEKDA